VTVSLLDDASLCIIGIRDGVIQETCIGVPANDLPCEFSAFVIKVASLRTEIRLAVGVPNLDEPTPLVKGGGPDLGSSIRRLEVFPFDQIC